MKTFTLRNTVAVAILAGAGLSGCAGDPYYDSGRYNQPYSSSSPHYGPSPTYNDPSYSQQYYYHSDRPGYRSR